MDCFSFMFFLCSFVELVLDKIALTVFLNWRNESTGYWEER
uniref:Uncharacterized protein n=1 Tax=Rhizophora mucronata TaxID=61149 RepID=A0A2P2QUT8_RHIMU